MFFIFLVCRPCKIDYLRYRQYFLYSFFSFLKFVVNKHFEISCNERNFGMLLYSPPFKCKVDFVIYSGKRVWQ